MYTGLEQVEFDPAKARRNLLLHGVSFGDAETALDADYIVVEIAKHVLGENWMRDYVAAANDGGIERVLV